MAMLHAFQSTELAEMDADHPTGKAAGGAARAASMSPVERSEAAKKAATKRWSSPTLKATHGSADHPLKIGDIEIPCYVLEDGRRVLSMRGVLGGLGMSQGTAGRGGDRLLSFASGKGVSQYVSSELLAQLTTPIKFTHPGGGLVAYGYEATILPDLCDAVLSARNAGALQKQQEHIAMQCEVLVRGFARVGIIALIDEATGYQKDRARDALATILEAFIAKELQPWVRTFPAEYYQELFRLRGLNFPSGSVKRPQYFGVLTNDIVYKRLAPGVLEELKRVTPRNDDGRPKAKYFQSLTSNAGYPKLREHLGKVIAMMQLSGTYQDFKEKLERLLPPHADQFRLALEGPEEEDDGTGL